MKFVFREFSSWKNTSDSTNHFFLPCSNNTIKPRQTTKMPFDPLSTNTAGSCYCGLHVTMQQPPPHSPADQDQTVCVTTESVTQTSDITTSSGCMADRQKDPTDCFKNLNMVKPECMLFFFFQTKPHCVSLCKPVIYLNISHQQTQD